MVQVSAKRQFLEFLSLFKFSDTCIFEFSLKDFSSLLTIRIGHRRVKNWLIFIFWGRPKRCQNVWIKSVVQSGFGVERKTSSKRIQFLALTCGLKYQKDLRDFSRLLFLNCHLLFTCTKTGSIFAKNLRKKYLWNDISTFFGIYAAYKLF